ncbi:MAG: C39 family peptidase [Promethearchaeota archaeon]|jgi:hypothetical protein
MIVNIETPRYIEKQQHLGSCGIVAAINVLKWYGHSVNYRDFVYKTPKKFLKEGMTDMELSRLFKCYDLKFKKYNSFTVECIEKHLDDEKAVVMSYYHYPEHEGHFTLITGHDRYYFEARNTKELHKKKSNIRKYIKKANTIEHHDIGIWVFKK